MIRETLENGERMSKISIFSTKGTAIIISEASLLESVHIDKEDKDKQVNTRADPEIP